VLQRDRTRLVELGCNHERLKLAKDGAANVAPGHWFPYEASTRTGLSHVTIAAKLSSTPPQPRFASIMM
jgi:hypothetical protein